MIQSFHIVILHVFILFGSMLYPESILAAADSDRKAFSHFELTLPDGWDGEEQKGFISDNPDEYLLTVGKKDNAKDHFIAQVSFFLLPNKPQATARDAAKVLTQSQGNATEPVKEGNFWIFTGEPRSRALKGNAKTMVNADKDWLLIIIAQDPDNEGSQDLLESVSGLTPVAKKLFGR